MTEADDRDGPAPLKLPANCRLVSPTGKTVTVIIGARRPRQKDGGPEPQRPLPKSDQAR
jgi:hypothetical protein